MLASYQQSSFMEEFRHLVFLDFGLLYHSTRRWRSPAWKISLSEKSQLDAATRQLNSSESISDAEAGLRPVAFQGEHRGKVLESTTISFQLVMAADLKPRRFRTKWKQATYEGPTGSGKRSLARWLSLSLGGSPETHRPTDRWDV